MSPDEKRFVATALMLAVAGSFLTGFLKGFREKLGEKAGEKTAGSLSSAIASWIERCWKLDGMEQRRVLEDQDAEIRAMLSRLDIDPEEIDAMADELEAEIFKQLTQRAPDDISGRIASGIRVSALKMILK